MTQLLEPVVGGVPAYVVALSRGLVERGWQVDVISPPDDVLCGLLHEAGATPRPVPMRRGPAGSGTPPSPVDVRTVRAITRELRARRPAILHAHSSKAGALGGIAGRLARVPSIYTPHSWAFQRRDITDPLRSVYAAIERGMARCCHRSVIVVSDEERRAARERRIRPPGGIHVVRSGLPPRRSAPSRIVARRLIGVPEDEPLAVWVGRRTPAKRPQDLAELARRLAGRVHLAALGQGLVGSPEAGALARAGGTVVDAAVSPCVLYAAGDVYVQTSAWEGLPLSVLEAMSAALPVVAYRCGGVVEQVDHGRTGFLVPAGDVGALAMRIIHLTEDGRRRDRMGDAAVTRVAERFSYESMVDSIEQLYASVARTQARGGS